MTVMMIYYWEKKHSIMLAVSFLVKFQAFLSRLSRDSCLDLLFTYRQGAVCEHLSRGKR